MLSIQYYLKLLGENADCKDTIKNVLDQLYIEMGVNIRIKYLVVVGDGKTYDHLVALKKQYQSDLEWMLPYPGDWHIIKNYQRVIMKIYADAGLKELLNKFHKGQTAAAVLNATNFRKTHNFITQSWEAIYRYEIQLFLNHLLQDYVLRLGKDHGKIRGRPYFGTRRGRSFAA